MIVGVDDVVRQPGMRRILLEQGFQHRRSLQLRRIRLVLRSRRLVHGERIENLPLHIVRIRARHFLHEIGIRRDPSPLRCGCAVGEKGGRCVDVGTLARRGRTRCLRFQDRGSSELDLLRRTQAGKRIPPLAERDSPVGDGTRRIGGQYTIEGGDRFSEPEGVQQSHCAVEIGPLSRGTRGLEVDAGAADLVGGRRAVPFVLRERRRGHQDAGQDGES